MNRTPQALHSVFGPSGPVRHCGVFSEAQWVHLRTPPTTPTAGTASLLLLLLAPPVITCAGVGKSEEDEEEVDEDEDDWFGNKFVEGARERLLLAPGPGAAGRKLDW